MTDVEVFDDAARQLDERAQEAMISFAELLASKGATPDELARELAHYRGQLDQWRVNALREIGRIIMAPGAPSHALQ